MYSDIIIDDQTIDTLPEDDIAPVEITCEENSPGLSTIGSRYDGSTSVDEDLEQDVEHDEVFQSAVVTDLDMTNVTSADMSAAALRHLRCGKGFVRLPHGDIPSNEYNEPTLFPLMYPSLFPYGVGGFDDETRTAKISMKLHVKHLLSLRDRRFQTHYSFLFTSFNILQRRAVSLGAKLKVNQSSFPRFASNLQKMSLDALSRVVDRLEKTGNLTADNEDERLVLNLMKEVNIVSKHVPGSNASRLAMRNEIRAMMMHHGLPSFYITLNPADIFNPLVRFIGGDEFDVDDVFANKKSKYWDQATLLSRNPFVGARFFDVQMRAFFDHILA